MGRNDRSSVATFYVDAPLVAGETVALGESAAHHAHVRRLAAGNSLRLTNGMGIRASAELVAAGRNGLAARVIETESVPRPAPIHLRAPIADRDRMLWLGEKAAELGITTWQTIRFRRSSSVSPRGEGEGFRSKLRARMIGAIEQSDGAWLPEILNDVEPGELQMPVGAMGLVLDRCGSPILSAIAAIRAGVAIVLGPEGGLEPDELELLTARGWHSVRLASTMLRFETAAIAAISIARAATLTEDA